MISRRLASKKNLPDLLSQGRTDIRSTHRDQRSHRDRSPKSQKTTTNGPSQLQPRGRHSGMFHLHGFDRARYLARAADRVRGYSPEHVGETASEPIPFGPRPPTCWVHKCPDAHRYRNRTSSSSYRLRHSRHEPLLKLRKTSRSHCFDTAGSSRNRWQRKDRANRWSSNLPTRRQNYSDRYLRSIPQLPSSLRRSHFLDCET